jgi:hypothetical protein
MRARKQFLIFACWWLFSGSIASLIAGEPSGPLVGFAINRTWSDKTGQFKIEGSMRSADAKAVQLLKSDGKIVTVPVDKLAAADKAFIDGFLAAEKALMGAAGSSESENPFAGGVAADPADLSAKPAMPSRSEANAAVPSDLPPGTLQKRNAIVKGFKPLAIAPAREFWSTKPPIAFPQVTFEESVVETSLPKPFFAGMSVMAGGKLGTVVMNSYQQGKRGEDYSKFVVVNASTGDASEISEFKEPWKLVAISPDGSRIAAVRIEGFDKGNDLAIFNVSNGSLIPDFQFTAGGGSWDELQWVAFLPENRLVTISQKHTLTIWDLNNKFGAKALKSGPTGGASTAVVSAAGELMAMVVAKSIALVETSEGKLVGCINRDQEAKSLAFSPDGQQLAAYHPFNVSLYSLTDGKLLKTVAVGDSNPGTKITWVGKDLLVGQVLYDVERGVPMWTYESQSSAQTSLGSYLMSGFGGDTSSTLVVSRIPHDEVLRAANEIDPNTAYAIKPGDSVRVEYDFGPTPEKVQNEIRVAVEEKIQATGWKIDSSAPNVVAIKMNQGKQEEAEYFTRTGFGPVPFFGPSFGPRPSGPSEKVTYQPWTHTLTITSGGKQTFISNRVHSAPQGLQTKDGESTQAAVSRICQPSAEFFKTVAIPPFLLKAEFQGGLGKTKITGRGLQ